jgi:hypothetical protein
MPGDFFSHPILNSPYEYPGLHWELDPDGQPTNVVSDKRRPAEFITPIPKPKKRKGKSQAQKQMVFDEGEGLSTEAQEYDPTPIINEIRGLVDDWRTWTNPSDWKVTPETARLLQHWRSYDFQGIRPFFCQIEAVEAAGRHTNPRTSFASTSNTCPPPMNGFGFFRCRGFRSSHTNRMPGSSVSQTSTRFIRRWFFCQRTMMGLHFNEVLGTLAFRLFSHPLIRSG